jgi:hypothetical protein
MHDFLNISFKPSFELIRPQNWLIQNAYNAYIANRPHNYKSKQRIKKKASLQTPRPSSSRMPPPRGAGIEGGINSGRTACIASR